MNNLLWEKYCIHVKAIAGAKEKLNTEISHLMQPLTLLSIIALAFLYQFFHKVYFKALTNKYIKEIFPDKYLYLLCIFIEQKNHG